MLKLRALRNTKKPTRSKRKSGNGATRKTAVEKKQPRSFAWVNRLLILLGVGVVLMALVKAAVVLHAIPVERIVVMGKLENTQTVALQDMVQPALVGGFLSADLQRIQAQLESLPWVYEASVRRQWPSALEIHVVEQLPIARWGEDGFLNHEGEVFHSTRATDPNSLPMLTGPLGSEQRLIAKYQVISEMLHPEGLTVDALAVDDRGQLRTTLVGGIAIDLGDEKLIERLERFVSLYRVGLVQRKADIRRVDMRYASGIAVAFNELPEVAGL
ncbi:MAG: cell division protein FtsQ/DivIB [Halioglobus sp.]